MTQKSLDAKLARILSNSSCGDFIIADAKDADMAFGMAAPGRSPEHHAEEGRFRSLDEYRELIRENVRQGLVDIMLMSASTAELLVFQERLFDNSHITPAIRANDTTDIWLAQGGTYPKQPSRPFRSASIDQAMCGKPVCEPHERRLGVDLGLYSVTFNNDLDPDHRTLQEYKHFREEAAAKGFRHFLEVFDPNAAPVSPADLGRFLNDMIARTVAGAAGPARPQFLKIAYHGPAVMEQLCRYDSRLVVGILGGSSGTTFDAFHQLWEAKKYGARVALYGRMINNAEHQLSFIEQLRAIADGNTEPAEAVRSYHGALQRLGIRPSRPLEDDMQHTKRATAYSGTGQAGGSSGPAASADAAATDSANGAYPLTADGQPDFARMTTAQKVAWNRQRWRKILG
ncbi:MAG: hypothetical protein U1E05_10515 [Patescibacteria group bacterium]|nr:hypothetical protein [Patescibacteria group bacterium]